jgi:hypothetical protein
MGGLLVAGALEALSAMAHKHLERGFASPFLVSPHLGLVRIGTNAALLS